MPGVSGWSFLQESAIFSNVTMLRTLLLVLFAAIPLFPGPLHARWQADSPRLIPTRSPGVKLEMVTLRGTPSLEVHLLRLDRKRTTLRVIDFPQETNVARGLAAAGALAGVNGGYFHPDRRPLGLVVSDGRHLHRLETSKLLSGLLVVTPKRAMLLRRGEYKEGPNTRQALQAGPFLVDHGRTVAGLNATRAAERTVLLADRDGVAALLVTQPVTLAQLGEILATPGLFPGLRIERALNLDGGSSTALWADAHPRAYSRPEWKRVRNAVAVMPRPNPKP